MADKQRIQREIAELATRPKSVRLDEIARLMGQIGRLPEFATKGRSVNHGTMYTVRNDKGVTARCQVTGHNKGAAQVKACYVHEFLDAMEVIGMYEG